MKKTGFTLIELLVVIGIIAMLVAIAVPNYLMARQRAADSKIKSDMSEFKDALRLYYNDFQSYPASLSPCNSSVDFASGAGCSDVYMKQFPSEFGSTMFYYQAASGNDFCLVSALNNKSDPDILTSQNRCASACGSNCPIATAGTSNIYCSCSD